MTDSPDEALEHIRIHSIEKFGLHQRRAPQRLWLLREKVNRVLSVTKK